MKSVYQKIHNDAWKDMFQKADNKYDQFSGLKEVWDRIETQVSKTIFWELQDITQND